MYYSRIKRVFYVFYRIKHVFFRIIPVLNTFITIYKLEQYAFDIFDVYYLDYSKRIIFVLFTNYIRIISVYVI